MGGRKSVVRMPLEERRRRLIEAAIVIVGESGLGAASTRAISTHAGMPLASFHYAFSSQQELMMVALHTLVEREIADHGDLELDGHTQTEAVRSALLMHLTDVDRRLHDYRALQELSLHAQHIPGFEELPAPSASGAPPAFTTSWSSSATPGRSVSTGRPSTSPRASCCSPTASP